MSSKHWRRNVGAMLRFKRQFNLLLTEIADYFDSTGEEFDQNFRQEFFRMTNDALLSTYADFLTKRLRKDNQIKSEFQIQSQQSQNPFDYSFESHNLLEISIEEIDIKPNIEKIQMEILTENSMFHPNDVATDEFSDLQDNNSMQSLNYNQNEENLQSKKPIDDPLIECPHENETGINIKVEQFSMDDEIINHHANKEPVAQKTHKCDVCSKEFMHKSKLKIHKRIHTGEKPFKCDVCSAEFSTLDTLKRHMHVHGDARPFKCDVCSKGFSQKGGLVEHMRIHTGEKPYLCDVCSKRFTRIGNLQKHMHIHSEVKPHKCSVCSKEFAQSHDVKVHMRLHTGEKPYKCNVCSKEFSDPSYFRVHKRIHTGEKPFKCDVCSKEFPDSCNLRRHKRIHTGEKPYKCGLCSKAFNQSGCLKTHMMKHAAENQDINISST